MTIVLVRHGETAGNAGLVLQKPEIPLNERGLQQAELVAARLSELGCAHILCSDLLRAKMTALALSRRTGIALEESELLQERNFGDLRGTPYSALPTNPFGPDFVPPNGEDWSAFHRRVAQAFELIAERRRSLSGTLVVVTHGFVVRALVERHMDCAGLVTERFDNTGITICGAEPPHTISLLNCTRHLSLAEAAAGTGGAA